MKNFQVNKHTAVILVLLSIPGLLFGLINASYAISTILLIPIIILIMSANEGKLIYRRSYLLAFLFFISAFLFKMIYSQSDGELIAIIIFVLFILTILPLQKSLKNNQITTSDAKIVGWTAVAILIINTFTRFPFYSEASHLGVYVVPFACLVPHLQRRFKLTVHIMLLYLLFMQMSLTVLVAWILTTIFLNKKNKIALIFIALTIMLVTLAIFYLDTRLVGHLKSLLFLLDPSQTSNLTVLVFVQGYEYIYFALQNLLLIGSGFESLAHQVLDSPAYQRLDEMGYPLNRSDGGLGLARISVEIGILASIAIIISIATYGVKILYLNANTSTNAVIICLWITIFVNTFLRGGGIFDASIVYLAMLTGLVQNGKKSDHNCISFK